MGMVYNNLSLQSSNPLMSTVIARGLGELFPRKEKYRTREVAFEPFHRDGGSRFHLMCVYLRGGDTSAELKWDARDAKSSSANPKEISCGWKGVQRSG